MFTINSYVAKVWFNAIMEGDKAIDDVPDLSNLIGIVTTMLNEEVEEHVSRK